MKILLTSAFLLLFFQISFSQDWALFPEGQKTYWEAGGEFYLYYNDVTFPGGFTNRHYFGADYLTVDSAFQCYKDILEYEYQLDEPPIDSIFSTPFYWFDFLGNDETRFYHLIEPGENWTNITSSISGVDSIVFSCISKSEETFFNVTDSVKIFTLQGFDNGIPISNFNGIDYKLSKKYGLIKFIPLRSLGSQLIDYEMMGFDDGQAHGFTHSWEDYFGEFDIGQKLKWRAVNQFDAGPGCYRTEDFYVDSILQIDFSPNNLELIVTRSGIKRCWKFGNPGPQWDSTASIQSQDTLVYKRSDFDGILNTPPGWFRFSINFNGHRTTLFNWHEISQNGIYKSRWLNNYFFEGPNESCDFLISDPSQIPTEITSCLGLTREGFHGGLFGEEKFFELIGYTKNGVEYGDIANPVFSRPTPNLTFELFPNPTAGELNIVFPEKINAQELELKILDLAGKIILQKNIKGGFDKIAVPAFPAGIYFVVVNGEGVFGRERFVKHF